MTGVDLKIGGKPVWNASAYSVVEDSTPLDPSDMSGGAGQFTFSTPEAASTKGQRGKVVNLADGAQGTTVGVIRGLAGDGETGSLRADSRMSALNATRIAQPVNGTLESTLRYYFGLVGLTTGILVDAAIATKPVVAVGWQANVWDQCKQLAAAYQFELSLVSDNIVARPPRTRIAENRRNSKVNWTIEATNMAQSVEVNYYQSAYRTNSICYPPATEAYPTRGWNKDVQVYQVDAGQKVEIDIPLDSSLVAIQQPVAVNSVAREYVATSVYAVSGSDGLIVPAAQWVAGGGRVTATISDDTRSIKLTIIGSSETQYAPYQLAMPAGPSDRYSSLRLVGTGVFIDKQVFTQPTGAFPDSAPTVIGATVDNEFINTYADAIMAAHRVAAKYTSGTQTIAVSTTGINRAGDSGSYKYPTIRDFNTEYSPKTIAQFNALWTGLRFADFNATQFAKVNADFANQAFGNVAGARVRDDGCWYRIRTATITPAGITYQAERDTTVADFSGAWAGKTIAQFNAYRVGQTIRDFNTRPVSVSS